jgi:hypothetical protein
MSLVFRVWYLVRNNVSLYRYVRIQNTKHARKKLAFLKFYEITYL